MKELLGKEIAKRIKNGDVIGMGTGSTVSAALEEIAKRINAEKLEVTFVPSSYQTARQCEALKLKVISPLYEGEIAWTFDGADEVDPKLRLIKGRGGAMLQEKILAEKSKRFLVIVDESKLVSKLGERALVPVEVVPSALGLVEKELMSLGAKSAQLRFGVAKHGPVITEAGNLIIDAAFPDIPDTLEAGIKKITGVVESGLFLTQADEVLVSGKKGISSLR